MRLEDVLETLGVGPFQHRVWLLCGLAISADGVEKAALMFIIQGASKHWGVQGESLGLLASTAAFSQAFGSYCFGRYSDARGRRAGLLMALAICFCFGVASALAPGFWSFLALRFFANFGIGGALPCAFTLMAEFLPRGERPKWIPFLYVIFGVGRVLTSGIAWALLHYSWRIYLLVLALPAGLSLCLKNFLPETPFYFLATKQTWQADRLLEEMARVNGVPLPANAQGNVSLEEESKQADNCLAIFSSASAKILCLLWFFMAVGTEWANWAVKILKFFTVPDDIVYGGLMLLNSSDMVVPMIIAFLNRSCFMEQVRFPLVGICSAALGSLLLFAGTVDLAPPRLLLGLAVLAQYTGTAVWVFNYTVTPSLFPTEARGTALGVCLVFARVASILAPLLAASVVETRPVRLLMGCASCYLIQVVLAAFLQNLPQSSSLEEGEKKRLKDFC